MPSNISMGYSSLFPGELHAYPTSRHDNVTPRHHGSSDHRGSSTAPTTTTTYTVRKEPLVARSSSVRDHSRTRRSSTIDSAQKRPIIVTTSQSKHGVTSHVPSSARPGSPSRDPYRSSEEGPYYTQPASSIRSRSQNRNSYSGGAPFSATMDNDEYLRLRERTADDRLAPRTERSARPPSIYASVPRHANAPIDYGDEGYEYTKPSDLARYDLDNDRGSSQRRRRDSFGRGDYYRPTVSVTTDLGRNFDTRRGPPPTTRGFDKINRMEDASGGIYDRPQVRMPAPPAVPIPPADVRRSGHLDVPPSPTDKRGSRRPVLYQDGTPRTAHHDDYYRSREDELVQRELRDRDRDRDYFHDESITSRGFGLRTDLEPKRDEYEYRRDADLRERERDDRAPARERREEQRREVRRDPEDREPRRRSDEDLDRIVARDERKDADRDRDRDRERDRDRKSRDTVVRKDDDRPERKSSKDDAARVEDDRDKGKVREKLATGLGIAASAIGLGPALKDKEKDKDKDDKDDDIPKRRKDVDDDRRREIEIVEAPDSRTADRYKSRPEVDERKVRDVVEDIPVRSRTDRDEDDIRERNRRDAEAKLNGDSVEPSPREGNSSSEEGRTPRVRRKRHSSAFKPTDTAGLLALKEQMKAMEASEKQKDRPVIKEPSPERRSPPSSSKRSSFEAPPSALKDESRGRELMIPGSEERQVRILSPPRDKDDKKPVKGILKQPKTQFPEEPNPVREGVAPHKDDKTKANVPPGARWTKISRKLVNPEALTIGKERFEVRDDFVIVLRVLSREEIQAYTAATAQLRGGLRSFHFPF